LLQSLQGDVSAVSSPHASQSISQFHIWILNHGSGSRVDRHNQSVSFGGTIWTLSTIRRRFRIVSGVYGIENSAKHSFQPLSSPNPSILGRSIEYASPVVSPSLERPPPDYFGSSVFLDRNVEWSSEGHNVADSVVGKASSRLDYDPGGGEEHNYSPDIGFFDWTRLPISDNLPRHIQFARSVDWASTPLGPIDYWPSDLRQMCNLIMASPHPASMYWGDDLVAIYNEAYIMLAGQKHPKLMGQRYRDAWAEIWDEVKGPFASAKQTGQATMKADDMLFMRRSNYLEETYVSWSIIPMVGADGTVCGLYNPAFEMTRRKIAERRMLTLREVGERTATARRVKEFWKEVENALDTNPLDTPFVLLYSVNSSDDGDSNATSAYSPGLAGSKQCYLEGALGVPEGHSCAPKQIDLKSSSNGFGPIFREVLKEGIVLLRVTNKDSTEQASGFADALSEDPEDLANSARLEIPSTMLDGVDWRGFKDPCRSVVVCPVQPTTVDGNLDPLGFIVLGVNPRRPYDADYSLFIQLLVRQLATSLASVVLIEEEIKRGQKAAELAALDRIQLSQQLAARTQEARDIETRFAHMANSSPAGLFIADSEGHISYCNDTWYEIAGIPKDPGCADRWIDYVKNSDQQYVRGLWTNLVENAVEVVNKEFCFKSQWHDKRGNRSDTWVLFSAHPEKREDSSGVRLKSVFGNITNISAQKWAQGVQERKMEEAVELKRQQENFIDITSHEMRNPLSAILQCADEISAGLSDVDLESRNDIDIDRVKGSIAAADTIILCAQHQKRIVDDILTLSKLDSHMLMVTPVDVQPLVLLQRALKMFEGETKNAGINLRLIVDQSYKRLNIDWARLDPQRVGQVLINLMTNAIKFTSNLQSTKRSIIVSIAASLQRPSLQPNPIVQYFPTHSPNDTLISGPDWGDGEELFIEYAVKDTGPGLQDEDRKMLFNRFIQASPRTHVQYGGSGLGLFISRELAELQSGEIGVASEKGKGSTFAFYVQSRRSSEPKDAELAIPANLKNVDSKGRRSDKSATNIQPKKRSEISLLIVEDNLVNQKVLERQLQNLGFTVHLANHGGEALQAIRRSKFWKLRDSKGDALDLSVVLMDQEMPVMDGMEATKAIRNWESGGELTGHVPIIGVTANARREQIEDLINAGMVGLNSFIFHSPCTLADQHRTMWCLNHFACQSSSQKSRSLHQSIQTILNNDILKRHIHEYTSLEEVHANSGREQ
jgi:signal transduction histidine kinase/CheY-like chemotaxis protein